MITERQNNRGFTLIELSIVLVIIGLIVGGVLVGRDLIHAAEIRKTITQVDQYTAAVKTFQGKYNCIPGDCANATDFFGAQDHCNVNWPDFGSTTCNGDGDGLINMNSSSAANWFETFQFWKQLALAKLISGNFSGSMSGGGPGNPVKVGADMPAVAMNPNDGFLPANLNFFPEAQADVNDQFTTNDKNNFIINQTMTLYWGGSPGLPMQDLYSIDSKIDDGDPIKGSVTTATYAPWYSQAGWPSAYCWSTSGGVNSYNLTGANTRTDCQLFFLNRF